MTTFDATLVVARSRDEVFTDPEALALGGFLAGYSGLTRDAYALDLRQYATWCTELRLRLFEVGVFTSKRSPATWRPGADRGPRSLAACARSAASTGTPNKRV